MPIQLNQHQGYGEAMNTYQERLRQANEAGDPAKIQEVENWWTNRKAEMTLDLANRQEAAAERRETIASLKQEFGDVPDAILANVQDKDQLRQIAEAWKNSIAAASAPPAQPAGQQVGGDDVTQQRQTQSWGSGAPAGQGAPQDDPAAANRRRLQELEPLVRAHNQEAAKEYRGILLHAHWPAMLTPRGKTQ